MPHVGIGAAANGAVAVAHENDAYDDNDIW